MLISAIPLTLYDYLLTLDDEVRQYSSNPFASPLLHILLQDSVCVERPQDVGFVSLFVQTVQRELM